MRKILAAVPVALALALAGCGSGDDGGGGVASAGGATGTTAGSTPTMSQADMALKFTECMRENGVPLDDPVDGKIMMKIQGISKEVLDKAQEACRQYSPQGNGSGAADPKMEQGQRDFAACMRENGVEAFPDPQPGQKGIQIDKALASDPDFEQASQKCQEALAGARG